MADTKLADLNDRTTTAGTDIVYAVSDPSGSAADNKVSLNNLFKRGEVTTSSPVIDAAQTWNADAVTFTGLKFNVTDTASASASLLMDIGTGGGTYVSRFRVSKAGTVFLTSSGFEVSTTGTAGAATRNVVVSNALYMNSPGTLTWSSSATDVLPIDLTLSRRGAANLRLGAADAAGSAISISSVASNQLTLASNHGLSNGAAVQITFTAGGAVPAGTAVNTTYYARSISAAVLELYGTYDQALNTASTTGRVAVTTAGTTAFVNRATPFQTLSVQSFTGTDIPGQPFVITGSQGTGTGAGGSIVFQVAPAGSSGTAQNALVDALTIDSTRLATFAGNVTVSGGIAILLPAAMRLIGFSGSAYLDSGDSLFHFRNYFAATEAVLAVDAANTLALRNGNSGQTLRVYGRYTSDTNHERFFVTAPTTSGAAVQLGTDKGSGGGTARNLEIQTDGTTRVTVTTLGNVVTNTAAVATTATDGFLYVPTCAGTPTGTPTTQTGTAPIVVDTTNNKLYFYSGGQWRDAGP